MEDEKKITGRDLIKLLTNKNTPHKVAVFIAQNRNKGVSPGVIFHQAVDMLGDLNNTPQDLTEQNPLPQTPLPANPVKIITSHTRTTHIPISSGRSARHPGKKVT